MGDKKPWGWIFDTEGERTNVLDEILSQYADGPQIQVEPGRPEQFCIAMEGPKDVPITVAPFPVGWRLEVVDDVKHRGFEYVRLDIARSEGVVH